MAQGGVTISKIVEETRRPRGIVQTILRKYRLRGNVQTAKRVGRSSKTTSRDHRHLDSLRRKRTNPSYVRLRNSAQIRVLDSRRVLHNVYLILIGVKLRSILDEF